MGRTGALREEVELAGTQDGQPTILHTELAVDVREVPFHRGDREGAGRRFHDRSVHRPTALTPRVPAQRFNQSLVCLRRLAVLQQ